MKQLSLFMLSCLLFSLPAIAADIPTVEEGDQKYDRGMCIEQYTNNCINSICLTSESRDCQEKCRKEAEDKCEE